MATRKTMNVSLTPRLERFVNARVEGGRFRSAIEVVREGVRILEDRALERKATLDGLRKAVAVGLAAARRGDLHDGEEFFREVESEEDVSKPVRKRLRNPAR